MQSRILTEPKKVGANAVTIGGSLTAVTVIDTVAADDVAVPQLSLGFLRLR